MHLERRKKFDEEYFAFLYGYGGGTVFVRELCKHGLCMFYLLFCKNHAMLYSKHIFFCFGAEKRDSAF